MLPLWQVIKRSSLKKQAKNSRLKVWAVNLDVLLALSCFTQGLCNKLCSPIESVVHLRALECRSATPLSSRLAFATADVHQGGELPAHDADAVHAGRGS